MKMKLVMRFFTLVCYLLVGLSSAAQSDPDLPEITAEGDQFYCPLSSINVVTDFSISGFDDEPITAFYIQISIGYANGDVLSLADDSGDITDEWDPQTGKLTLSKQGNVLTYQEITDAVKNVIYRGNDPDFQGEKYFSFTVGNANFLPSTGHFYEYIEDIGITWTSARALAEAEEYLGLPGYLATITSFEEKELSGEQADGAGWIGGSDAALEGTWKWVTGPEAGMTFWIGLANGYAPNGAYEFWNDGEPNQAGNEDYAHITDPSVGKPGSWNDLSNTGASSGPYQPKGYIIEYGFGGPEDAPDFSASTRIYTNGIDEVVDGSNCGPGEVILSASLTLIEDQPVGNETQVLWFESLDSDLPISTGETYMPNLTESKDYYVLASQNECYDGQRKKVTATIYEIPDIIKEVTLYNCDADDTPNDGYTDFNLEEANDLINKGDLTLTISYYMTEQDAQDDLNRIDPPVFNNFDGDLVFARAVNLDNCYDIAKVNLVVSVTNPFEYVATLEACDIDGSNDGFFTFDLLEASVLIIDALGDPDVTIKYYENQEDAALKINEILPQDAYMNKIPYEEFLFARIESSVNGECISVGEYVQLKVNLLPEFEVPTEAVYCQNQEDIIVEISAPQGIYSYEWKDPSGVVISTSSSASISSGGIYTVTGTSEDNCVSNKREIVVSESSVANITQDDIEVVDGGEENSILIDESNLGVGNYEYALDNSPYQEEPFFDNVSPGDRILYIRDKNGCGTEQITVYVIGYMKFFTPNGDGENDTWQVLGVSSQPMSDIYIYDKFGKLLAQLDAADEEGWDGVFNGKQLPSSDYWFRVQLEDGRIQTGHFSLIR